MTQNMHNILKERQIIREKMRKARRNLTVDQQRDASIALHDHLLTLTEFKNAKTIALYLSSDGEIDPSETIKYCWAHRKKVFLPVLDPENHHQLLFVNYLPDTNMCLNKYKISEPALPYTDTIDASELDIVLLPLVAFDQFANRMGMGGGYYDRTFSFKNNNSKVDNPPLLIGLAHHIQQLDKLKIQNWDVPLHSIVTDVEIITAKQTDDHLN